MKKLILFFGLLIPALSQAQSYSIDWFTIDGGGGGTSTGKPTLNGSSNSWRTRILRPVSGSFR